MKRALKFTKISGMVECILPAGRRVEIPAVLGILKHPGEGSLYRLLTRPAAARKYTIEAIKRAPWSVIRRFPRSWLEECIAGADIRPGRRKALEFMLCALPASRGKR